MASNMITRKAPEAQIGLGKLLVAKPLHHGFLYKHSVILIIEYGDKKVIGVVLNVEEDVTLNEAAEIFAHRRRTPLYAGGPVKAKDENGQDCLEVNFIHNCRNLDSVRDLGNELFWSGDFEEFYDIYCYRNYPDLEVIFYNGMVEWTPEELENEIKKGKWWVMEPDPHTIFKAGHGTLWSVLAKMQGCAIAQFIPTQQHEYSLN